MNKVILHGTIGSEPELKQINADFSICSISLATNDVKKGKNGEWEKTTDWHRIEIFGKAAENFVNMAHKGDSILVEGKLKTNTWEDKEGVKRTAIKVNCEKWSITKTKFTKQKQDEEQKEQEDDYEMPF